LGTPEYKAEMDISKILGAFLGSVLEVLANNKNQSLPLEQ
jgi:hypothetical protein